jgi:hypothetical protein
VSRKKTTAKSISLGASVFVSFEGVLRGVLGENNNHPKHYPKHYKTSIIQNTCLAHLFYKSAYSSVFNTNG